ncbi:MAG: ADP-ribosyltransferase-containing protein [Bellilinea sp.]
MDLPIMIPAGMVGGAKGAAVGGAVAGPPGAVAGGAIGGGAAMFGSVGVIRESLMQAYKAGDAEGPVDWFNIVRSIAGAGAHEAAIGAVTMGAGAVAARVAGKAIAPMVGTRFAVPTEIAGKTVAAGALTRATGTADVAAQIAAMVTMPAAMEGRLPEFKEFGYAAGVILTLKAGHVAVDKSGIMNATKRVMDTYVKTGKTPAEQVADAQKDASVAAELVGPPSPFPERPLKYQEQLFREVANTKEVLAEIEGRPLKNAEDGAEITRLKTELAAKEEKLASIPNDAVVEASSKRIYEDVREKLLEAGRDPMEASAIATLASHQQRRGAERLGVDPWALYSEKPIQVRGGDGEVSRGTSPPEPAPAPVSAQPIEPKAASDYTTLLGKLLGVPDTAMGTLKAEDVPVKDITLSKDVPQFKSAANEKGVVEPLGGKQYDELGTPPIIIWERADGRKEVISGRHRFDLAGRTGAETIPAQIVYEKNGFTAKHASLLDAALNIRDQQGTKTDFATFFRENPQLTTEMARDAGLLARPEGKEGFEIAQKASDELIDAMKAGQIEEKSAYTIAINQPNNAKVQMAGIARLHEGHSLLDAVNWMQMFKDNAEVGNLKKAQMTLGGIDEVPWAQEAAAIAEAASKVQMAHSKLISSAQSALKRPEEAAKMGINISNAEQTKADIKALIESRDKWKSFALHSDLLAEARDIAFGKKQMEEVLPKMNKDDGGTMFQDRKPVQTDTPEFKNWFGDSKVADADGKPLVVYHGSPNDFNIFDIGKLNSRNEGPGFYFTTSRDVASGYGTPKEVYLGIQKPLNYDTKPFGTKDLTKLFNRIAKIENEKNGGDIRDGFLSNYGDTYTNGIPGAVREAVNLTRGEESAVDQISGIVGSGVPAEIVLRAITDVTGYDGIFAKGFSNLGDGSNIIYVAFRPEQIKSAIGNRGTFDPNNPNILMQDARPEFALVPETPAELKARNEEAYAMAKRTDAKETAEKQGKVYADQIDIFSTQKTVFQKQEGKVSNEARGSYTVAENLITFFKSADRSTGLHEFGHSWLEDMKRWSARPDAPAELKADWEILRKELAIADDGKIGVASHEQWARGVERYVMEGKAPSLELQGVFQRFSQWLTEIYKTVLGLNVEISPAMKDVMDRMLANEEQIAMARELGVPKEYAGIAGAERASRIVEPTRKIEPGFKAEQISMEPFSDELPRGPGSAPDTSHVNYKYINSPMDVKLTMQKMAEIDQANIQAMRGGEKGVKSWDEANAEQAKYVNDILGGSPDTLRLLSGEKIPGPDVRLGVLKKLAVGAAKDSARLRDVVLEKGENATVQEQLQYMGSIERARMIQAEFLGERAGVARALNALKDVTEGSGEIGRMLDVIGYGDGKLYQSKTPAEEAAILKAKLDEIMLNYKGKTPLDIAKLHKQIGSLKGTFVFAKEVARATTWEKVVEAWKAGLLSGPITPVTNIFGTSAFQFTRPLVDAVASGVGIIRGAKVGMGESDRASMSESLARLGGMTSGIQDALKLGWNALKVEGDPTMKVEAYRHAIEGTKGKIIRFPFRLMSAGDIVTTSMYQRGELATLAMRKAFDEGLSPKTREFSERIQELIDNPTAEMAADAQNAATRMAFNTEAGEKLRSLQTMVKKAHLEWMLPFIRTPANIAMEMARMSPFAPVVGRWRADIAKGGVARDKAIAEVVVGSGIMALTIAYASSGNITGSGDPDPGKKRTKEGVEQPYSVKIGDTWYEYSRIQPMGTLMGMAADMSNVWEHMTDDERDKIPKLLATAFGNAITNQTFLQGITNVVNAISDPGRFGPRFAQQLAGSTVPNIVGQTTTISDPYVRQVNSMLDAIRARLPGRQDMPAKLDWLGEPVETKERVAGISPIRTTKISDDKVRLEAARLGVSVSKAPNKVHLGKGTGKLGDVDLTPEEQTKFAEVGGKKAHEVLGNIVNSQGWENIPDPIKKKIFERVLTASHAAAAVAALPPEKRIAYINQISDKIRASLQPEQVQ